TLFRASDEDVLLARGRNRNASWRVVRPANRGYGPEELYRQRKADSVAWQGTDAQNCERDPSVREFPETCNSPSVLPDDVATQPTEISFFHEAANTPGTQL